MGNSHIQHVIMTGMIYFAGHPGGGGGTASFKVTIPTAKLPPPFLQGSAPAFSLTFGSCRLPPAPSKFKLLNAKLYVMNIVYFTK